MSFSVRKQSGANTVDDRERKSTRRSRKCAPSFPQLQIKTVHNDAESIMENVDATCAMHIIFGGIMAVLVIFVFMRDWRSTLITRAGAADVGDRDVLLHVCRSASPST